MKDNKEFIDGVYKKYKEYQDGKKFRKVTEIKKSPKKNITKILSVAAMAAIVITGVNVSNNIKEKELKNKISKTITYNTLSLKTIDNFENLCKIAKENPNNNYRKGIMYEVEDTLDYSTDSSFSPADLKGQSVTTEQKTTETNSSDYSKTNIQVENVDEADVVKTDGKYIYYIAENKVVIIDIKKQEELNKVAEISYTNEDFTPSELYINENKLIVIGNVNKYTYSSSSIIEETMNAILKRGTYKQKTVAIIYDLNNIQKPKENRRIEIEGNYVSSRMIENNIYLVANKTIYTNNLINSEIKDLDEKDFKPTYTDTAVSTKENYIDFSEIHYFELFISCRM